MASTRVLAAVALVILGLSACGGDDAKTGNTTTEHAPSKASVVNFFEQVVGASDAMYLPYRSTAEAQAAVKLVVLGQIVGVDAGPTLGDTQGIAEGGGVTTVKVTVRIDQVVSGTAPGTMVDFLLPSSGSETADVTLPVGMMGFVLGQAPDGQYQWLGPQSLATVVDGVVTMPLLEVVEATDPLVHVVQTTLGGLLKP